MEPGARKAQDLGFRVSFGGKRSRLLILHQCKAVARVACHKVRRHPIVVSGRSIAMASVVGLTL